MPIRPSLLNHYQRNRLVWLAITMSVVLHAFMIYSVRHLKPPSRPPASTGSALIVHLLALQPPVPQQAPAPSPIPHQNSAVAKKQPPARAAASRNPAPATAISVAPTAASPAPSAAAPTPPASTNHLSARDIIDAARRDVGSIDRELRQAQAPSHAPIPPASPRGAQEKLASGIAASAIPRGTTIEDITRPDGQRVTKVTGPAGTYCVTQISVGNSAGMDIMQRGAGSRTTNCGD
ncbi:hypothetical protein [Paraherbaspirillum soli]|uniref:Uncharacterized protein n=1 Tax=Paraherbaspirillum soli TaxID=631222 RepID=A0ABW0M3Q8_9BURK